MKIGIGALTEYHKKICPGDNINYMDYILEEYRKRHQVVMFDWKDVKEDFSVSNVIFGNSMRIESKKNINLEKECDIVLLEEFGNIRTNSQNFVKFLNYMGKFSGVVINDPKSMLKGFPKDYLLFLQKKNLPVIPTAYLETEFLTFEEIKQRKFNSEFLKDKPKDYVIKPVNFGEKGQAVKKLSSFKDSKEYYDFINKNKPMIIQQYIPEIKTKGENSFMFLGKQFSHAINKCTGEFLVNFTGKTLKYNLINPSMEELDICQKVLDIWPYKLGYTRIDMMYHENQPLISEVEVINPTFYVENILEIVPSFTYNLERFLEGKL